MNKDCQRTSLVKILFEQCRADDIAAHHQARKRKGSEDIAFKK
jgi:hypothetical protein